MINKMIDFTNGLFELLDNGTALVAKGLCDKESIESFREVVDDLCEILGINKYESDDNAKFENVDLYIQTAHQKAKEGARLVIETASAGKDAFFVQRAVNSMIALIESLVAYHKNVSPEIYLAMLENAKSRGNALLASDICLYDMDAAVGIVDKCNSIERRISALRNAGVSPDFYGVLNNFQDDRSVFAFQREYTLLTRVCITLRVFNDGIDHSARAALLQA